jgi:hypothetical protein
MIKDRLCVHQPAPELQVSVTGCSKIGEKKFSLLNHEFRNKYGREQECLF